MGKQTKLSALRASDDCLEFWGNDNPKCPHCGTDFDVNEHEAWHLYSEDGGEVTCPSCDLDYRVSTHVAYTFCTDEQDDDQ